MYVLDLSLISDDKKVGVLCETLGQFEMLLDAIKIQRPDIDCEVHREMTEFNYANKVYYLNYMNSRRLQHGSRVTVRDLGLSYVQFNELWHEDLPDISVNQTGILSLLGVE